MDKKFKAKLERALRKLSWSWKPYGIARERAKVDKATFECQNCGKYCYTGKSEKSLTTLKEKYTMKNVEMCSICVDHIDPVVDPKEGFICWDTYINRLYCDESNLQVLCLNPCHKEKSKRERLIREKHKTKEKE
jgi:hypothetical protein